MPGRGHHGSGLIVVVRAVMSLLQCFSEEAKQQFRQGMLVRCRHPFQPFCEE